MKTAYIIEELKDGKHSRDIDSYSSLDKALKGLLILVESKTGSNYRLWKQVGDVRIIVEKF